MKYFQSVPVQQDQSVHQVSKTSSSSYQLRCIYSASFNTRYIATVIFICGWDIFPYFIQDHNRDLKTSKFESKFFMSSILKQVCAKLLIDQLQLSYT
jgi:hypothetical protein